MEDSPITRPSLLVRIRDARDAEAWEQFVEIYAPLVYHFVRKRGLQDADAADLTQDVLHRVGEAIHRLEYDPKRGTFRGWLFTVTRNRLYDFLADRSRQPAATGDTGVRERAERIPAASDDETASWDREYERSLFEWAARQVRPNFTESTWKAFWRTAVEGKRPGDVASDLGLRVGAVYIAKSRVTARLREALEHLRRQEG